MTWTVIRFSQMLGSPNKPNRSNSSYFIRNTFYQNMTQNNDFLNFKGFTERKQNQTLTEWSYGLRTLSKTFWYCWIRSPLWVICVYHANKNEGHPVHPRVVGSWMIWCQVRLGFSHRSLFCQFRRDGLFFTQHAPSVMTAVVVLILLLFTSGSVGGVFHWRTHTTQQQLISLYCVHRELRKRTLVLSW